MDCPICFDAITAATGLVTTSCGHSFHLSCIAVWYSKEDASCPCCRRTPTSTETITPSDDDYTIKNVDEEDEEVEFTHEQLATLLRVQGGYGINYIDPNVCPELASFTRAELNALCQGNGGCSIGYVLWDSLMLDTSSTLDLETQRMALRHGGRVYSEPILDADILNPEEIQS